MSLNVATFKTRSITAAVFVIVMLAGVLWNQWSFFILFSVIHFGCWMEYQRLIGKIDPGYNEISSFHRYGVMIAGWCILLYFTNNTYILFGMPLHELGWWLGLTLAFTLPIIELLFSNDIKPRNIGYSALGLLYISLSWGLLLDIRNNTFHYTLLSIFDKSWILPMVLIGSIWINDTMAYIIGSLIGKTPLSSISPKKTWEGTAGGALLAIIVVSLLMKYLIPGSTVLFWIGLSAIAAIFGTMGDLAESKLKRMAKEKDSGHFLPGHGGFLDRFDSLLVATIFAWIYIALYAG